MPLPGRDGQLPHIYQVPHHSLVGEPHGRIFIAVVDHTEEAMGALFQHVSKLDTPSSKSEFQDRGKNLTLSH
jgi:hypothetical protein